MSSQTYMQSKRKEKTKSITVYREFHQSEMPYPQRHSWNDHLNC